MESKAANSGYEVSNGETHSKAAHSNICDSNRTGGVLFPAGP